MVESDNINFVFFKRKKLSKKRKYVFSDLFIPDKVLYRDNEIIEIAKNISEEQHIYIIGMVATGKTLSVLRVLKEAKINEAMKDILFIYHNCAQSTVRDIYSDIAETLEIPFKMNRSNISHNKAFKKRLKEKGYSLIYLCLDEIEQLIYKYSENELMLHFGNYPDLYKLILISNTSDWRSLLKTKESSRLKGETIKFKNYTEDQMRGILKQRVELGLETEIINDIEIGHLVKSLTKFDGNLRDGIFTLENMFNLKVLNQKSEMTLPYRTIESLLKQSLDDSQIADMLDLSDSLILTIYCITLLFDREKERKTFKIKDITDVWNELAQNSKRFEKRGYTTIRKHLIGLETYHYIKKKQNTISGKSDFHFEYIPTFDINEFKTYFDVEYSIHYSISKEEKTELFTKKLVDKITKGDSIGDS